ncbi:guanine nucleotide-binding protein G(I)/G(S)/G(O) subunit gamma-10 isoform 1-T3 [Dugong dugon]
MQKELRQLQTSLEPQTVSYHLLPPSGAARPGEAGSSRAPGSGASTAASPPGGGAQAPGLAVRPSPTHPPSDSSATAAMSSGPSVNALQRLVEQLKLEAGVERIKVSQAAAELQQYCMQNACKDALLVGVPAGSNPFREPRSCALL